MIDIVSTQIRGALENAIFNQIIGLNLNISSPVLRAIVSRVAEEYAVIISRSVFSNAGQQLTSIPQNLIGIKNPVDLVTSNLGSSGIQTALGNILSTQLTAQLTDRLVTSIEGELKTSLPTSKRNLINFDNLAATLVQSITPTVSNSISTALGAFAGTLFSGNNPAKSLLGGVESLFKGFSSNPTQTLDKIDENFALNTTTKYLEQAKNFNIKNADNEEKLQVLKTGFQDPTATYPTKEYAGRSDTNKLATGDVAGTIIQDKNKNRMLGAKLPGGEAWDEPESAFKGEYPYNKVTETESGHIIEIDDTPGSERLHVFHKAGTYIEIDSNGSMVRRIKGSSYEIIDRNGKISISGRADISVTGACNIYVGNDANIEVEGDTNITCHNDITAQAGGTLNLSAREFVNITGGNVNIEAYNSMNVKSNVSLAISAVDLFTMKANVDMHLTTGNLFAQVSTDANFKANSDLRIKAKNTFIESEENYNELVGATKFLQAADDINFKAGGTSYITSGGDTDINSGGSVNVDGSAIQLNNNYSSEASNATESSPQASIADVAGISNIGVMSARKDIVYFDLFDPQPLTLKDTVTLDLEEQSADAAEKRAHEDKLRTTGVATTEEIERVPVEQDSAQISSTQGTIVPGSSDLLNVTSLPGNYNLSPNFTLEMLTYKAAITKDMIETSELPYGQIVFNLQCLALNVLEPVYNLYPNAFVTSAYRQRKKSSASSQHPLGRAVDIQFKGASKQDYFEIAKRLAKVLKYDQLLLEFCAYTNNPWIHISYTDQTNRVQVMTFWNHKKHSDGLTQLA